MSEAYINQLTLDLLLNKDIKKNKLKKENKKEIKFYRKRTYNLFKEIINGTSPEDLSPDVKYAYDNFVNSTIHYFKTKDRNDIIQTEYKDFVEIKNDLATDDLPSLNSSDDADKLLMRSIKLNIPTLDKYVLKPKIKNDKIIMPQQKEINLNDEEFKNKGIKNFAKKE